MINIGLIGEDPNDTSAITNLMKQRYDEGYRYLTLSQNKRGSQMFTDSALKSYNVEIRRKMPDHIIVIIDADAIITEEQKINAKKAAYRKIHTGLTCKSKLLLLNIYELEALILADINTFNNSYRSDINFTGSVMHKENPKGFLTSKTAKGKKYQESHCPELFKLLKFDIVIKKCPYFNAFINEFEIAISG